MLPLQRENVHRLKAFLMLNRQEMHLFGKIQGILHADKGKPLILMPTKNKNTIFFQI